MARQVHLSISINKLLRYCTLTQPNEVVPTPESKTGWIQELELCYYNHIGVLIQPCHNLRRNCRL